MSCLLELDTTTIFGGIFRETMTSRGIVTRTIDRPLDASLVGATAFAQSLRRGDDAFGNGRRLAIRPLASEGASSACTADRRRGRSREAVPR